MIVCLAMYNGVVSAPPLLTLNQTSQQSVNMALRGWMNRGEEIIRSEVGQDEFNRRLEKQKLLFKVGNREMH